MQHVSEFSDEGLESLYTPPEGRHLRAGFIASLDGAVELDGRSGTLGDADDHRVFVTLRALCDVILIGSKTAQTENYGPAKLSADRQARRRARGQAALPPIAVVNALAALDPGGRLFVGDGEGTGDAPRPFVLCSARAPMEQRRALADVATVIECGDEHVEVDLALAASKAGDCRRCCARAVRLWPACCSMPACSTNCASPRRWSSPGRNTGCWWVAHPSRSR